jgi:hypothetical protein
MLNLPQLWSERDAWETAIHEGGHAAAVWSLGPEYEFKEVSASSTEPPVVPIHACFCGANQGSTSIHCALSLQCPRGICTEVCKGQAKILDSMH